MVKNAVWPLEQVEQGHRNPSGAIFISLLYFTVFWLHFSFFEDHFFFFPPHNSMTIENSQILYANFHLCSESWCRFKSLSRERLVIPWAAACQAPLSLESRQECWSGLPFPSPGDLPDPGMEPTFSCIAISCLVDEFFTDWPTREPGPKFQAGNSDVLSSVPPWSPFTMVREWLGEPTLQSPE